MAPSTRSFACVLAVLTLFSPVRTAAQADLPRNGGDHSATGGADGLVRGGVLRILLSIDIASADIPGDWTTLSCGNARDTVLHPRPFWKFPGTTTRDGSIRGRDILAGNTVWGNNIVWGDIIAWGDNIVWGDNDAAVRASAVPSGRASGGGRR